MCLCGVIPREPQPALAAQRKSILAIINNALGDSLVYPPAWLCHMWHRASPRDQLHAVLTGRGTSSQSYPRPSEEAVFQKQGKMWLHRAQRETVCAHVREWGWIGRLQFSKGPRRLQRQPCQSIKSNHNNEISSRKERFQPPHCRGIGGFL